MFHIWSDADLLTLILGAHIKTVVMIRTFWVAGLQTCARRPECAASPHQQLYLKNFSTVMATALWSIIITFIC